MKILAEKTEAARQDFFTAARACGSDPIVEENAALNIGREFLPAHALAVLDKTGEPTIEYWEWLTESVETAQAEHDREIAAGHEWSEVQS